MKIKVTNRSVELKLTLEDTADLRVIASIVQDKTPDNSTWRIKSAILNKKLRDALEAANKLNWMDGM